MSLLPDTKHLDIIDSVCLAAKDAGAPAGAVELAEAIFALPELPMHCPYHHYLTAAVLLTSASILSNEPADRLRAELAKARTRAAAIPGGVCGEYGCCGAAIGAGIFADIRHNTSPLSKSGWAVGNRLTARSLEAISSVEGPRCCKRVTYLTLCAAIAYAKELSIDLGEQPSAIVCSHFSRNRECRRTACPFFPKEIL